MEWAEYHKISKFPDIIMKLQHDENPTKMLAFSIAHKIPYKDAFYFLMGMNFTEMDKFVDAHNFIDSETKFAEYLDNAITTEELLKIYLILEQKETQEETQEGDENE